MTVFVLLAILLIAAAVAAIALPLLRPAQRLSAPAIWSAVVAGAVLVIGAGGLYAVLSNYSWKPAQTTGADSPEKMVARLASRLKSNPNDLQGWLMLGRSYAVLENFKAAIRAFETADRLAGGKNADALVGLGEVLAMDDEAELNGRAGELFEKALQLEPKSQKALFYSGAAAVRRGDLPVARERFTSLIALNPPPSIKTILEKQIETIDHQLGNAQKAATATP